MYCNNFITKVFIIKFLKNNKILNIIIKNIIIQKGYDN